MNKSCDKCKSDCLKEGTEYQIDNKKYYLCYFCSLIYSKAKIPADIFIHKNSSRHIDLRRSLSSVEISMFEARERRANGEFVWEKECKTQ